MIDIPKGRFHKQAPLFAQAHTQVTTQISLHLLLITLKNQTKLNLLIIFSPLACFAQRAGTTRAALIQPDLPLITSFLLVLVSFSREAILILSGIIDKIVSIKGVIFVLDSLVKLHPRVF